MAVMVNSCLWFADYKFKLFVTFYI